jgi:hypothetical protein
MSSPGSISSVNPLIPNAVIGNVIFPNLSLPELGACSRVCKAWKEMAKKHINAFCCETAFGAKEWYTYFGCQLRNIPRLPLNIAEIMNSPCLFGKRKKVHETHLLVLIPETVNSQPLTLKKLEELVQKILTRPATKYRCFDLGEYTDPFAPPSHWVLMTRDVIEGTRNQSYQDQQTFLTQKSHGLYSVPTILDATVCIFMQYVRSETRLYGDSPYTWTRCVEKCHPNRQLCVGGFALNGLGITFSEGVYDCYGVGGSRKLYSSH